MKKMYMPNDEQLERMQSLSGNVYKYLLVKAAEAIIVEGTNYSKEGMLKSCYKYLAEMPDVAHAVCRLYPEEIAYSKVAAYDTPLLSQLINKSNSTDIYNLDNLEYFNRSTMFNSVIIDEVINKLYTELPTTPNYRYEYKQNDLLESIFSCNILPEMKYYRFDTMRKLAVIEPAYLVTMPKDALIMNFQLSHYQLSQALMTSINAYANRYGISKIANEKKKMNINLKNDEDTKKLVRFIRNNNTYNLY